jgi:hypothetical protein
MQVDTLLDTGAVQGDYCSRAVGDYVRQHCPENWRAADEEETIALAASGTSTMALGSCIFNLILNKEDDTTKFIIKRSHATIIDLAINVIVGRPKVRELRLVHVFPYYFCAYMPPSAPPQPLDASPVIQQTPDEVGHMLDASQHPTEPAEHRGRKQGEYIAYIQELQHPQGAPPLGSIQTKITGSELASRDDRALICEPSKHADLHAEPYEPSDHSHDSQHPCGAPFLGNVGARVRSHSNAQRDTAHDESSAFGTASDTLNNNIVNTKHIPASKRCAIPG